MQSICGQFFWFCASLKGNRGGRSGGNEHHHRHLALVSTEKGSPLPLTYVVTDYHHQQNRHLINNESLTTIKNIIIITTTTFKPWLKELLNHLLQPQTEMVK